MHVQEWKNQTDRDLLGLLAVMQGLALTTQHIPEMNLGVLAGWLIAGLNFHRMVNAAQHVIGSEEKAARSTAMRSVGVRTLMMAVLVGLVLYSGLVHPIGVFSGLFSLQIVILVRAFLEGMGQRVRKRREA